MPSARLCRGKPLSDASPCCALHSRWVHDTMLRERSLQDFSASSMWVSETGVGAQQSPASPDYGIMPHSNILFAMGAATLFRNCSRIFGSLFSSPTIFCFAPACWGSGGCSF